MAASRIVISHQYGEIYPNVPEDFAWAGAHRRELLERYGEGVVLIYHQQVIGSGQTLQAALEDADQRLPSEVEQVTPIIEYLGQRHRVHLN
jgi:hypothetical protein